MKQEINESTPQAGSYQNPLPTNAIKTKEIILGARKITIRFVTDQNNRIHVSLADFTLKMAQATNSANILSTPKRKEFVIRNQVVFVVGKKGPMYFISLPACVEIALATRTTAASYLRDWARDRLEISVFTIV